MIKSFLGDRFGYTITAMAIQGIEITLIPKAGNSAQGLTTLTATVARECVPGNAVLLRDQVIGIGEGDGNILVNTHLAVD